MRRPSRRNRRGRRAPDWAPEPPVELPPGRLVHVKGRGEFFVRDSQGEGTPVLLLHGWMFPSDLNWFRTYKPLAEAGYRVLAVDHRGHGRGLRTHAPFRLEDCAADAAAILRTLGCPPAVAVGYSMGGPIAQLMARHDPDTLKGLVLCATSTDWTEPRMKALWRTMGGLRLALNAFPIASWRGALRAAGFPDRPTTTWISAELSRGSARDLAEAGRELGRYDSRPWIHELSGKLPAAVVVTARDRSVPPRKQRELAAALRAVKFEDPGDHDAVVTQGDRFAALLLEAIESLEPAATNPPAPAEVS